MNKLTSSEELIFHIIEDFKKKTGVNIFQSQLTQLFKKQKPDVDKDYIAQYVAIYVNGLADRGIISKTTAHSKSQLVIKKQWTKKTRSMKTTKVS